MYVFFITYSEICQVFELPRRPHALPCRSQIRCAPGECGAEQPCLKLPLRSIAGEIGTRTEFRTAPHFRRLQLKIKPLSIELHSLRHQALRLNVKQHLSKIYPKVDGSCGKVALIVGQPACNRVPVIYPKA